MNFKITPAFTQADFQKEIDEFMQRVNKVMEVELRQLGLDFVRAARLKTKAEGGYDDQTGNLRSSIGFILMYDGQIISEDFELSTRGTIRDEGLETGRKMAHDIAAEYPKGWAIITVAGMEYASWLQAKNYDVIEGATLSAEIKMAKAMNRVLAAFK